MNRLTSLWLLLSSPRFAKSGAGNCRIKDRGTAYAQTVADGSLGYHDDFAAVLSDGTLTAKKKVTIMINMSRASLTRDFCPVGAE